MRGVFVSALRRAFSMTERRNKMTKRLVKTLPFESGELYGIVDGRRLLLATCKPKAELYECLTDVPVLGAQSYKIKSRAAGIVLCPSPHTNVTAQLLSRVSRFELSGDVVRLDGVLENVRFDSLIPQEIDLDGDWKFEIPDYSLLVKLAGI